MYRGNNLLTSLHSNRETSQPNAWLEGYRTFRLNFVIPAIRIHSKFRTCGGRWFAVDTYNISLKHFQDEMAMVNSHGKSWTFKQPEVDWYLLKENSIFNVGLAKNQGSHAGGGLQFEFRSGPWPVFMEKASGREFIRL